MIAYGSPGFGQASEFARAAAGALACGSSLWRVAMRHPRSAASTVLVVSRLPSVEFTLSGRRDGEIGRRLERWTGGLPTGRLARAVLTLPQSEAEYLQGRHRQALRTNVRRAQSLGVTCRRVDALAERVDLARQILANRTPCEWTIAGQPYEVALRSGQFFVAMAADGSPVAFSSVAVESECSYLLALVNSHQHEAASWARYLLQCYFAVELGQAGVKYLLADSALDLPPGLQYFQHLVGFRAANVKIRPGTGPRAPGGRRRVDVSRGGRAESYLQE